MKIRIVLALVVIAIIAIFAYVESQITYFRQITSLFIDQNWVALLSFAFSFLSLWVATVAYRNETRARIRVDTSPVWDLDLETHALGDDEETTIVTPRAETRIDSFIENAGGCATTLKKLEIIKRGIRKSLRAEVRWRRDFELSQIDRNGNLIPVSIWDRIEPGQRVRLLLPFMVLLDVMVTNDMLDLHNSSQGHFSLVVKHVYGEAESSKFEMTLSDSLRSFISERIQAFGRIIVRD